MCLDVFNLRTEKFKDPRVREALSLTFDFPWLNTNIFYGAYHRTQSFFQNSDMQAHGLPSPDELTLLAPFRKELLASHQSDRLFTAPLPIDHPLALRERLRLALNLLRDAGYSVEDGRLINRQNGKPLTLEVLLYDSSLERVVQPMLRNMARLGIQTSIRIVDVNQYLNRLRNFDYDMVISHFPQSNNPGNEQRDYWTSASADQPQSHNLMGLKHPAVDSLVDQLISADNREQLNIIAHALDRVLRGLIKPELLFKLFNKTRVDSPCTPRIIAHLNIATPHIQACAGHGIGTFKTCQHLVNGATRCGLNDHKIE